MRKKAWNMQRLCSGSLSRIPYPEEVEETHKELTLVKYLPFGFVT